jgi:class 3 adenylate cyclase
MRWITRPETPATGPRCASEPRYDLFDATHVRDSVPGVFIHATAVRNLLERQVLTATPPWADHAFDLLLAACAALLGLLFKPIRAGMTLLGVFILWAAMAGVTLDQGLVLPLIVPMIASAAAFGAMLGWRFAVTDRESRFLHDSFALYLAPDLVDGLVNDNNPPALGGEEREVTLYFSDLAGFSTMSEGLAPMETVRIMNAYLGAMTEEIERHGGVVDKYIGDAIVAIFGAPLPTPDHAERAAQAALNCGARLVQLNSELTGLKAPLGHRIGLNSGLALIGNIGSDRRFNYTAMGDTVNLAARLEGANKVFGTEILVSETTAKGAPAIPWRELDLIRVVGRSTPVAVLTPLLPGEEALAEAYGAALAAFRQRDFSRTLECLAAVTQPDKASALLRQRAQSYQNTPPPADWQPINDLVEK